MSEPASETPLDLDALLGEYHRLQRRLDEGTPKQTLKERSRRRDRLSAQIMAHPDSFDRVRCWMVDITGKMGEVPPEELEEIAKQYPEKSHAVIDRGGGLAQAMRRFLDDNGFLITDSGMGDGSWTLGAYCTEPEARRLCCLLYRRFRKAIGCGIIRVDRLPWSIELATPLEERGNTI